MNTFPVELIELVVSHAPPNILGIYAQLNSIWYRIAIPKLYSKLNWMHTDTLIRYVRCMESAYLWRFNEFRVDLKTRLYRQLVTPMPMNYLKVLVGGVVYSDMQEYRKHLKKLPGLIRLSAFTCSSIIQIHSIQSNANVVDESVFLEMVKLAKDSMVSCSQDNVNARLVQDLLAIGCPVLQFLSVSSERDSFGLLTHAEHVNPTIPPEEVPALAVPRMDCSGLRSLKSISVETRGHRPRYPLFSMNLLTPCLDSITLNFIHMSDQGFRSILYSNRHHLTSLSLGCVSGLMPGSFNCIGSCLPHLSNLSLTYTSISNDSLRILSREAKSLTRLSLFSNYQISDLGIQSMTCHVLKHVELGDMNLSVLSLASLLDHPLHSLAISELPIDDLALQCWIDSNVRGIGWNTLQTLLWTNSNSASTLMALVTRLKLELFKACLPSALSTSELESFKQLDIHTRIYLNQTRIQ